MATIAEAFALALRHHQAGELHEAEQLYRQILQAEPGHAESLHHLGVLAHQHGRHAQAADWIEQALRLEPLSPACYSNLGLVYQALGRPDEAVACFRRAVYLCPDYAQAHNNLANVLGEQGRPSEAEACCREALRHAPDFPEALNNLGNILMRQGKTAEAAESYRQALRFRSDYAECHANLGLLLRESGEIGPAEAAYREALRLRPDLAEAHAGLGHLLREQGRLEEAEDTYRQAFRLRPEWAQMHNNLGLVLQSQGRWHEALASYQEAIRCKPDYAEAHWNQALLWLLLGNFERGWPEYDWRWRTRAMEPLSYAQPRWDGASLPDRTILLHAEQGLGDTLQFVRYARRVKERGLRVVAGCRDEVVRLVASCPGVDVALAPGARLPAFTVQASLLSLPEIFGTNPDAVPAEVPYLFAEPELAARWREEIGTGPGLRIGIAWHGSATNQNDRWRSVSLGSFAAIARLEDLRLFSLQKGAGSEELRAVAGAWPIHDLGSRFTTFADTAAALCSLDLVIAVDTAVAHCAGALGVPVWVALPFAPDWRWQLGREDSPWYPSMRLFRQQRRGDWEEVFERIARELATLASSAMGGRGGP